MMFHINDFSRTMLLIHILAVDSYIWDYTEEAYTSQGKPCLTNCINGKCYVSNKKHTEPCVGTGIPSPIYYTALNQSSVTVCSSNCGHFGYKFQWCMVESQRWDFCSNAKRSDFVSTGEYPQAKNVHGGKCEGSERYCLRRGYNYNTCSDATGALKLCAPPADTRIPILPVDFRIGRYKQMAHCFPDLEKIEYQYVSELPDDYLENWVKVLKSSPLTEVKHVYDLLMMFPEYTLTVVHLKDKVDVPVAIEAEIHPGDVIKRGLNITMMINKHLQQIKKRWRKENLKNNVQKFKAFANTPVFETPNWKKVENTIDAWIGGNVHCTLLIVIFYKKFSSIVPHAIGISLIRHGHRPREARECRSRLLFNGPIEERFKEQSDYYDLLYPVYEDMG